MRTIVLFALALTAACSRSDTSVDKSATEEPSGIATITSAAVTPTRPSDNELIRRLEGAVAADRELSMAAKNVEVDVVEGIVTFRGSVDALATKDALDRIAKSVPGVVTTLDKVELRGSSEIEVDDTISFSLQRSLVTDPRIAPEAERISIEVKNGVVTLRGASSNAETREAVERIARRTPGVVFVNNRITIRPPTT